MKRFWRYVRKSFLPAAVCSLALLTGCGSSETLAEPPQNKSGETITETITEAITETPPTESPAGEDVTRSDYVTVVEITINPKVALYVAADGSVVKVEYLNEDARNAFSDLVLVGESLEDAVSRIVDTAVQEGYLTDSKMISVDFVEVTAEEAFLQELTEKVQTAVQDTLTDKQLSAPFAIEGAGEEAKTVAPEPEVTKEPCPDCGGTGICPECGGGTLPCKRCGGSLWESCGVCGGGGRQSCPGCGGSGKDATSGSSCRHCNGAGSITCEVCGGSGGKACSICNGKGVVSDDCILCHGGKACITCGGTGLREQ